MGLAVVLQGKFAKAPNNPLETRVGRDLRVATRRSTLALIFLVRECYSSNSLPRSLACADTYPTSSCITRVH